MEMLTGFSRKTCKRILRGAAPRLLSCFFKSRETPRSGKQLLRKQQWYPPQAAGKPRSGAELRFVKPRNSRKGTFLFFSLVRKEPKVHQRVATLWTPGTVQNSIDYVFSWHFQHSSLNRRMVRLTFSDVLNRCERVAIVQTQDWCFSKMGCRTASSQGQMYSKRGTARYLCCGGNLFLAVCL